MSATASSFERAAFEAIHNTRYEEFVMTDLVLIPCPGIGTLALTRAQFDAALQAGGGIGHAPRASPPAACTVEALVDAHALAERTGVPKSWWMAQARGQHIPYRKIARRVRFDPHEVLSCPAFTRRSAPTYDASALGASASFGLTRDGTICRLHTDR